MRKIGDVGMLLEYIYLFILVFIKLLKCINFQVFSRSFDEGSILSYFLVLFDSVAV